MTLVRPAEFRFLQHPGWADGADLIKLNLQELCMLNVLEVTQRWKQVDRREAKKRLRPVLKVGTNRAHPKSRSDQFILRAFGQHSEIWFTDFRVFLKGELDKDYEDFRKKYIYEDARDKELCRFRVLLTAKGRSRKKLLQETLDRTNTKIDELLRDNEKLASTLALLGTNVILLEKVTLDKLRIHTQQFNLETLNLLDTTAFTTIGFFHSFGSIDTADFSADFGGFGGGDFGGGGGGDSW
jgi:hypothetical protein